MKHTERCVANQALSSELKTATPLVETQGWTLGVNIDHVATLREARYRGQESGEPDPVDAALAAESAGAHGITAHLREDRRHLQDRDLWRLRETIRTRLNFEMANVAEMVKIALQLRPYSVCLVPEHRMEVTTEGGMDVPAHIDSLKETIHQCHGEGILVSLFIDPEIRQVEAAAAVQADFVELHTGSFGHAFGSGTQQQSELNRLRTAAQAAHQVGLRVNAGHGLTVKNVPSLSVVPHLEELNIGHHLVCRALMIGLAGAIREMLDAMALGAAGFSEPTA